MLKWPKYFTRDEFKCRCCGVCEMDQGFIDRLARARAISDHVYIITSGFRCPKHNEKVSTVGATSPHLAGHAADISAPSSRARYSIITGLLAAGFNRIGIGANFVHVDDDPEKEPNLIWGY